MLDLELIRREPELVRQALLNRGETVSLEQIIDLDARRRAKVHEVDTLRSRRNEVSRQISKMLPEESAEPINEMRQVGERINLLREEVRRLDEELRQALLALPNIPLSGVVVGLEESSNVEIRRHGDIREFAFTPLAHWDLAERLGIIDLVRGAKLAGSRFFVLKDAGVTLHRALVNWMVDLHVAEHGYREVAVPYLVRREVMEGSGNLPKFGDNLYHDEEDDLWLIPTAEVPITNLYREEILEPDVLPLYYICHTSCFRREKAAAGKDTRGIKRVHQFEKVELYKFVTPESSDQELEMLVRNAEEVCRRLEIPYRVLQLCTGEMGFASAKSYDLEMWAPGSREWLEVSSCSSCTDFQARRADIRFRREKGARPEFVHTLNGSGLALPRVLISVLENYQQPDGSVLVPTVLQAYTGFDVIRSPAAK